MLIFDQLKRNDPQLRWLTLVVLSGLSVLLAGLWWVQVVSAREYKRNLETQSFRTVRIPAERGKILDRNGVVLAENRPNYAVGMYFEELRDDFRKEYSRIRPARMVTNSVPFWQRWFGVKPIQRQRVRMTSSQIDDLEWRARYDVAYGVVQQVANRLGMPLSLDFAQFRRHYMTRLALPYTIADDLNATQLARFEEQPTPQSVDLETESLRYYPNHTTAAHLLGYLLRDDRSIEGEDAFFSYRLADYRGAVGIEGGYDKELHGRAGVKSVLVNNLGYRQTENIWTPVEPGKNIVLTIDVRIQQAAEEALRHAPMVQGIPRGAAVVMDVRTGDILAMASSPTFDPNDFIPNLSSADAKRLQDPSLRPEINRATQENYAPGSIFKPLVGLACLQAGLDPNATIANPGYIFVGRRRINDLAAPGDYDLRKAIMHSSNTYFITNGMDAGIENIVRLGQRLHLGERVGLATRQETSGYFPNLKRIHSNWYDGDTANLCIGQGFIAVTPLQMAVMTCALANGGKVLWPRLVARIETQDPNSDEPPTVFPNDRVRDNLGVSQRNLQIIRDDMLAEVEDGGTGSRADVAGLRICGKTGTAEITDEHGRKTGKNTWFISFAPYESPRYAVVVLVEHGNFGGTTCAPVAQKIYEAILKRDRMDAARSDSLARSN